MSGEFYGVLAFRYPVIFHLRYALFMKHDLLVSMLPVARHYFSTVPAGHDDSRTYISLLSIPQNVDLPFYYYTYSKGLNLASTMLLEWPVFNGGALRA